MVFSKSTIIIGVMLLLHLVPPNIMIVILIVPSLLIAVFLMIASVLLRFGNDMVILLGMVGLITVRIEMFLLMFLDVNIRLSKNICYLLSS